MPLLRTALLFIIAIIVLQSCGPNKPENLDYTDLVKAKSKDIIPVKGTYQVQFVNEMVDDYQVGVNVADKDVHIQPNISYDAVWENTKTIVIRPSKQWSFDEDYVIELDLSKSKSKTKSVSFYFTTLPLEAKLELDEMSVDAGGIDKDMNLKGSIITSDFLAANQVMELLDVAQSGNDELNISWDHRENAHFFQIKNIKRGNKASQLVVSTANIGDMVNFDAEYIKTVPAKGEFMVMNISDVKQSLGYIEISFSDELDSNQDLLGLISLAGENIEYTFDINGNKIKIYPEEFPENNATLKLTKNIKSRSGKLLQTDAELSLKVIPEKPQIRLLSKGNILPKGNKAVLAFEAKALKSVKVEIFKIYENNVLEYFQDYGLKSNVATDVFGNIVHHETIELETQGTISNLNEWNRFALDLDYFVSADPASIYQVRLGFGKEDVVYNCDQEQTAKTPNTLDEYRSFYNYNNYYSGYKYEHRNDPCFPAYYSREQFVSRTLMVTNVGLTVKKQKDQKSIVYASHLINASELSGVKLQIYNRQKQLTHTGYTDSEGKFELLKDYEANYIIAELGGSYTYMNLRNATKWQSSNFDVNGTNISSGINGFLYGERGVWRPGDTISLSLMLSGLPEAFPDDHPITFDIYNPKRDKIKSFTTSEHIDHLYTYQFATKANDVSGRWQAKVKIGNSHFTKTLRVETIKPNRLKIALESESDTLGADDTFMLKSKWLHGTPSAGLKARVNAQYREAQPRFAGYQEYQFNDPARRLETKENVIFDKALNEAGEANIPIKLSKTELFPGNLRVNLATRVFEKGGNFSEHFDSRVILPFESYVGVKVPKNRWGSSYLNSNAKKKLEIVLLDRDGKPIKNKALKVGVYESKWSWWYNRSRGNIYKYNTKNHLGAFKEATLVTDSNGKIDYDPKLGNGYGNYLVRVCDDGGHCAGDFFYTGRYYSSNNNENEKAISKLQLELDKSEYNVGERVKVNFPTSKSSRLLVTIENSSGVIQSQWIDSQGDQTSYEFTATKEMLPNVYVSVSMLQKWEKENDLPIRMYGIVPVMISDASTILSPNIELPSKIRPNDNIAVTVSEKNGSEMSYTIAMVDEGLLDLTSYKTPNPHKHFFAKQALSVVTSDQFEDILNKMGVDQERIITIGGDGAESEDGNNKANVSRFKAVVYFDGPIKLKAGQINTHNIKIPNYMGSVKFMVVAKNNNAFGHTEIVSPIKKELMLMTTLPRVLSSGEQIGIPVNAFWTEPSKTIVNLSLDANDILDVNKASEKLSFDGAGDQLGILTAKVKETVGPAKIRVSASAGNFSAYDEIEIDVRNPNPIEREIENKVISAEKVVSQTVKRFGVDGTQSAYLEISHIPAINLESKLNYLISYPYGCLEQAISKGFPQMFLEEFVTLSNERKQLINQNVVSTISKLSSFRNSSGSFNYWPSKSRNHVHDWSNIYAGHFMVEARRKGYTVPKSVYDKWLKKAQQDAKSYTVQPPKYNYKNAVQAYRLMVLAMADKADIGAMNRLRSATRLNISAKYMLAAAYGIIGQEKVGGEILDNFEGAEVGKENRHYSFYSSVRDMGISLYCLPKIGRNAEAARQALDLAKALNSDRWNNTHALSFALLGLSEMGVNNQGDGISYDLMLNDNAPINVRSQNKLEVYDLQLANKSKFEIRNTGQQTIYASVVNMGKREISELEKVNRNLKISVTYLDENKKLLDISSLKQGQDFYAKVKVSNPGTGSKNIRDLALSQVFPSGWEIRSGRLSNQSSSGNNSYEFQDVKDDRVNTFFSIFGVRSKIFEVALTATYPGKFYLPPTSCESMYNNLIYARTDSRWVNVSSSE